MSQSIFKCNFCNNTFIQKTNLQRHINQTRCKSKLFNNHYEINQVFQEYIDENIKLKHENIKLKQELQNNVDENIKQKLKKEEEIIQQSDINLTSLLNE
jgi:regulator of replication initiation timing